MYIQPPSPSFKLQDDPIATPFGSPKVQQMGEHGIVANQAYLFIFSPRNIAPQVRRSNIYRMDDDFLHMTKDFAESIKFGEISNIRKNSFFNNTPISTSAVIPTQFGTELDIGAFNDFWSFMLIVDTLRGTDIFGTGISNTFDRREVLMGYIQDEPFNMTNMGQGMTFNPNAVLHITHKTVISNVKTVMDNAIIEKPVVESDRDIINKELVRNTSPHESLTILNPVNLIKNMSIEPDLLKTGQGVMVADEVLEGSLDTINVSTPNETIVSNLNSPRHHLSDLVTGIASTNVELESMLVNDNSVSFHDISDTYLDFTDTYNEMLSNNFENMCSGVNSFSQFNRATRAIVSQLMMGDLVRIFPNIQVNDCRIPRQSAWDAASQVDGTLTNIASSFISSSLPAIMSAQGISQVAFRYLSRHVNPSSFTGVIGSDHEELSQLFSVSTFLPMSDAVVRAKYNAFLYFFKTYVFPSIKAMGGEFDLTVHAAVAGVTLVKIHFLDDGNLFTSSNPNDGLYESATSLGGIISPTIGGKDVFLHNATQLGALVASLYTD